MFFWGCLSIFLGMPNKLVKTRRRVIVRNLGKLGKKKLLKRPHARARATSDLANGNLAIGI